MKNALMIIVSVVVGYGFAYLSASKKWAPFGNAKGQEALYSKTIVSGDSADSGDFEPVFVTEDEMNALSSNYVEWITELKQKSSKGNLQKGANGQMVTRGGKISAALLDRLAKGNEDVFYVFGKKINRSPIYLLLSDAYAADGTTPVKDNMNYYVPCDSATMCPCVCPNSMVNLPPECNVPHPQPVPPVDNPTPTPPSQ